MIIRSNLGWELVGLELDARHPYGWRIEAGVQRDGRYVAAPLYLAGNARRVFPDRDLLLRFIGLADGSDDAIVSFARDWGTLRLCRRGLPLGHDGDWKARGPLALRQHTCSRRVRDGMALEAFVDWRFHARRAAAILSLGTVVHDPMARPEADWASIGLESWRTGSASLNLSRLLNEWLVLGRARPCLATLDPTETAFAEPRVELVVDGLYGGIGLLLLMAVARSDEVIPCSEWGCTRLARPGRRGSTPYCPDHSGPETRSRDRQRRYRVQHRGTLRVSAADPSSSARAENLASSATANAG